MRNFQTFIVDWSIVVVTGQSDIVLVIVLWLKAAVVVNVKVGSVSGNFEKPIVSIKTRKLWLLFHNLDRYKCQLMLASHQRYNNKCILFLFAWLSHAYIWTSRITIQVTVTTARNMKKNIHNYYILKKKCLKYLTLCWCYLVCPVPSS